MSEPTVTIPIKTTFDGKGTTEVTRSLKEVQTELKNLRAEMKKVSVDSPDFAPMRDKAGALATEIKEIGDAHKVAAKKRFDFSQAMLQGSRGIQDLSVAGVPGMVNNLEGLASALGATAGAAGGVTLVAVAIDLLMRNWGTLAAAFGSADEVKGMWAAMTPDEVTAKRLDDMATSQERFADALQRTADARKNALDAQQAELDWMEKRKKLWEGIVPTPEQQGQLPALPGQEKPSAELTKAAINQAKAEAESKAKLEQFKTADEAFKAQQARVDSINKITTFDMRLKLANAADDAAMKGLNLGTNQAGQAVSPNDYAKLEALQLSKKNRAEKMRSEITLVPGLTDGLTGDAKTDSEKLSQRAVEHRAELKRLEKLRYDAAQQSAQAQQQVGVAANEVNGRAQFEREDAAQKVYREDGIAPAPGLFGSADERAGIPSAIEQQRNQIQQGQQQVEQALKSQGDAVVQSLGQLQTGLTGTLGTMVQTIASLNSRLGGIDAEVKGLAENTRR